MADLIAIAETLEAQAAALRREAARLAQAGQAELALEPAGDGAWIDWPGGEQPTDTYGKNVDVQDEHDIWTGPASLVSWHLRLSYRISADQPTGD